MKETSAFSQWFVKLCSFFAIRYLKRTYGQGQRRKELFATKRWIVKVVVSMDQLGSIDPPAIHRYFTIHKRVGKGVIGDPYKWYYEKYLLYDDNTYYCIRSGKYPHQWEFE